MMNNDQSRQDTASLAKRFCTEAVAAVGASNRVASCPPMLGLASSRNLIRSPGINRFTL